MDRVPGYEPGGWGFDSLRMYQIKGVDLVNYAYVTLATDIKYLYRALYLQSSLERVKSKYPLIILINENLLKYNLIKDVKNYKVIPLINFEKTEKIIRYKFTLNKFYIFNLIEYDRVCFLDADLFILSNIDNLFEKAQEYDCIYAKYLTGRYGEDEILPQGRFFTVAPNKNFFNNLLNDLQINQLTHYDDEHMLKELCFPRWSKITTFEELSFLLEQIPICFHGKWHMHYPNITYKDIITMTDKEVLLLFQKEIKRKTISYLRNKNLPLIEDNISKWEKIFWERQFLFDAKEKIE